MMSMPRFCKPRLMLLTAGVAAAALMRTVHIRAKLVIEVAIRQREVDHGSDTVGVAANLRSRENIVEAGFEPVSHRIRILVDRFAGNQFQAGCTGHRRQRVAVEGARVIHPLRVIPFGVATLGDHIHYVRLAADGPARQRARNDLGHGGQVWRHSVAHLGPAGEARKPVTTSSKISTTLCWSQS